MSEDKELRAMGTALSALEVLDQDERKRVLSWLSQKLAVSVAVGSVQAAKSSPSLPTGETRNYSTDTIATIVGARSGRDLIVAAAAHLHFAQGRQTFGRHELAAQLRSAPAHFKSSYINNLSSYLASLTRDDKLRSSGSDVYALSNRLRQELEAKLAAAE